MPYYGGALSDLRRAGLAIGAKAIDDLFFRPRLIEKEKEAAMQKAAAIALLGGLATTPAGPEHVAGGEALKKLGIDLPLIDVEQRTAQTVPEYEAAKRITVPPTSSFTPPPTSRLLPKLAGISPGSLDQLIAATASKEGLSASQLGDIKSSGLGLLERMLLLGAPKYGAPEELQIKKDKLEVDKISALIDTLKLDLAKATEQRQTLADQSTERDRIRKQALDLNQELDITKDPKSAANTYAQLVQLHKQYPDLVTKPQFPERFDGWYQDVKKRVFGTPTNKDVAEAAAKEATTMKFPRRVQLGDGTVIVVNTQEEYDKIFKRK